MRVVWSINSNMEQSEEATFISTCMCDVILLYSKCCSAVVPLQRSITPSELNSKTYWEAVNSSTRPAEIHNLELGHTKNILLHDRSPEDLGCGPVRDRIPRYRQTAG